MVVRGGCFLAAVAGLIVCTGPVHAQINMDSGKSAAQIFAATCNACHRSPREIKPTNAAFLREHYTAGRNEAAAMAAYLASVGSDAHAIKQRPRPVLGAGRPEPKERVEANSGDKVKPQGPKTRRPSESIEVGKLSDPALTQTAAAAPAPPAPANAAVAAAPPAPHPYSFEE
jgi:hypothetical protein